MAIENGTLLPLHSTVRGVDYAGNFSRHNSMQQLAFLFNCKGKIDFPVMRKALEEEIKRNDALCVKIKAVDKKTRMQCFVDPSEVALNITEADFSSKTEEDIEKFLQSEIRKDMQLIDGDFGRFVFIKGPNGKDKMLSIFSHYCVDGFGLFITVNDIFNVYLALLGKEEMPKPLSSWRTVLEKELAYTEEDAKADYELWKEAHLKVEPRWFFGDRFNDKKNTNKKLTKYRICKDPDPSMTGLISLFKDKSAQDIFSIPSEKVKAMTEYCEKNGISMQNLIIMGMRLYMSYIHGGRDYDPLHIFCNRRAAKAARSCGGCMLGTVTLLTKITKDMTVAETNAAISETMVFGYRHCQIDGINYSNLQSELKWGDFCHYGSSQLSVFGVPEGLFEKINGDFRYLTSGCSSNDYTMFIPRYDGSLDMYFNYRLWHYDAAQSGYTYEGFCGVIDTIVNNDTSLKVEEIYKALDKIG